MDSPNLDICLENPKRRLSIVNPYLDEFENLTEKRPNPKGLGFIVESIEHRRKLCAKYAWAIPNNNAIKEIAKLSPLVEIGAGTGYWASLLSQAGAKITAYDKKLKDNKYGFDRFHFEVKEGTEDILEGLDNKLNLFLCWPNYDSKFAYNCLKNFKGKFLAYVGEGDGGCTGDDKFHELLEKEWEEIKRIELPQWPAIHDRLTIHKRKNN